MGQKLGALTLLLIATGVFCAGCTITRGYEGPERPESEISRVYFYSGKGIDLGSIAVDGKTKSYFDLGIDILPGTHSVWMTFSIEEESCEYYGCSTKTISGKCEASLRTEAGKKYAVRVSGAGDAPSIVAEEESGGAYAGAGSCKTTDVDYGYKPKPAK